MYSFSFKRLIRNLHFTIKDVILHVLKIFNFWSFSSLVPWRASENTLQLFLLYWLHTFSPINIVKLTARYMLKHIFSNISKNKIIFPGHTKRINKKKIPFFFFFLNLSEQRRKDNDMRHWLIPFFFYAINILSTG